MTHVPEPRKHDRSGTGVHIVVPGGGRLRALFMRLRSYGKRTWCFGDYPVRVWKQDVIGTRPARGFAPAPWAAEITNWLAMGGHGDTREEALASLRKEFDHYRRIHRTLPRPGTLAFPDLSSAVLIDRHRELARDFLVRVLGVKNPDHCIVFDTTSLRNFRGDSEVDLYDEYLRRIMEIYGVDVSDIEGARLGQILERIASHRKNSTHANHSQRRDASTDDN